MKIKIELNNEMQEPLVKILCRERTREINRLCRYIGQFTDFLWGEKENEQIKIAVNKIQYVESVERKTFLYTEDAIYEAKDTLSGIEEVLNGKSFIRISKSYLLNLNYLKKVVPYENHRILATLENGEQIIVGRAYINDLKRRIKEGW